MKNLLVVEDDHSIRELLVDIFESEGYRVVSCVNGAEALSALEENVPDVILMDIMMPIMDGYEFHEKLTENSLWNSIPLLAMSAQDQTRKKLAKYGITNFINKPLELDHLLNTVKNLSLIQ